MTMRREIILKKKAVYELSQLTPSLKQVSTVYPELLKCQVCNKCTMSCPQDINVMEYISSAVRGEIAEVADQSFSCIMCGLCAERCSGGLAPYHIALLCRRLYGRYLLPRSRNLSNIVFEIEEGRFDAELSELKKMDVEELRRRYNERDIVP
jgi:heterodisulfide reductase subunit C